MKKVVIGALLGLSSLSSFAEDARFSAEVLVGKTDQELSSDYGDTEGDDTSIGIRGAFLLNKNFALELSYHDYGEADDSYIDGWGDNIKDSLDSSSFNLGVKGILPLNNGFSLHARLGVAFWDVELSETDSAFPGETFKGDDSGNDFYYGIGAQCAINEKFTIGVEYTVSEFDTEIGGDFRGFKADVETDTVALTAGIKF